MRTLYVAWQDPGPSRAWYPIGRLDAETEAPAYTFRYVEGAIRAQREASFRPLFAFPNLGERYESAELFPLFKNRVLSSNRREFADYLRWLGLDPAHSDPIEILAVSGGERQTDSLEVFPRLQARPDGTFVCRFFIHGLRHVSDAARHRAESLRSGEVLQVALEVNNPATGLALQIQTQDGHLLGWAPRYLVTSLLSAISAHPKVSAKVVRANEEAAPFARRILVEIEGRFPPEHTLMSGLDFSPVAAELVTQ